MSLSINDLQPKNIKITIRGVEITSKPLKLKHALQLAKVGVVFQDLQNASNQDIDLAEKSVTDIFGELMPELKSVELTVADTMTVLNQLMETIEPEDNKELDKLGVKFDKDPKGKETG